MEFFCEETKVIPIWLNPYYFFFFFHLKNSLFISVILQFLPAPSKLHFLIYAYPWSSVLEKPWVLKSQCSCQGAGRWSHSVGVWGIFTAAWRGSCSSACFSLVFPASLPIKRQKEEMWLVIYAPLVSLGFIVYPQTVRQWQFFFLVWAGVGGYLWSSYGTTVC